MNDVPHYLRFARALALVSGVAVAGGCGAGTTGGREPAPGLYVDDSGVDVPGDGSMVATDVGSNWDGHAVGVFPLTDSGTPTQDTGTFCCGVMAYAPDAAADAVVVQTGVQIYDASTESSDVPRMYGGPLMPPELPEDFA